mmetsp:Transcript_20942/g.58004  ORF Transcript_20942/g.58004 Transcript_20942/m.58004 type:complete len:214 (+) Transcript_20942:597-1238(+)
MVELRPRCQRCRGGAPHVVLPAAPLPLLRGPSVLGRVALCALLAQSSQQQALEALEIVVVAVLASVVRLPSCGGWVSYIAATTGVVLATPGLLGVSPAGLPMRVPLMTIELLADSAAGVIDVAISGPARSCPVGRKSSGPLCRRRFRVVGGRRLAACGRRRAPPVVVLATPRLLPVCPALLPISEADHAIEGFRCCGGLGQKPAASGPVLAAP